MSMLYLAQAAADARPGLAIGYIAAKIGMVILIVIGLVKLVNHISSHRMPPPSFTAPQPYTPTYWATPTQPPHASPMVSGQIPPWPPQSPPPAKPPVSPRNDQLWRR